MKRLLLTLVLVLTTMLAMAKVIKNPAVEYTPGWLSVHEVELTSKATVLRCKLQPRSQIMSNTVLVDRNTGKEYKLLRVEGVETDKWITRPDGSPSECALCFEPVDKGVKEVNLIEPYNVKERPEGQMYGISLVAKAAPKKAKAKKQAATFEPDTAWRFSNKPYKHVVSFYQPGKARVNIHFENIPRELREMASFMSLSLMFEDQVMRKRTVLSATLDNKGIASFDLDLPGPASVGINPICNVFVQPGDTLDVITTLEPDENYRQKYIELKNRPFSPLYSPSR